MDQETKPAGGNRRRKNRRRKVFAVLPTLLTLGNAVCGFGAIMILARVTAQKLAQSQEFLVVRISFFLQDK